MTPLRNRVFPLTITALTPVHIGTGARLAPDVDFYADGDTVFVVDTDVALELVAQRWADAQLAPDEQRRQAEAALEVEEQRLLRRRERNKLEIEQFPASPPQDRRKVPQWEQRKEKLVREVSEIKALTAQLKARRAELATQVFADTLALPDDLVGNSGLADLLNMGQLTLADLRERATFDGRPLVRYALAGRLAANAELYEMIKDVADHPYLPGSSLKGAIRSALAWDVAASLAPATLQQIGRSAKTADDDIEAAIFLGQLGPDRQRMNNTLRDVLRTLHIGDSAPVTVPPELLNVAIFRSSSQRTARLAVEAIPAATVLRATLQVERYPFESAEAKRVITFDRWQARLAPEALAQTCRARARDLIAGERAYFDAFPEATEVARFYQRLEEQLAALGPRAFLLPVGWGAGWRSKTLDTRLRGIGAADESFADAVRGFKLKKHKSATYQPGGSFPDTRKLALAGDRPSRPLGWLRVELGEEKA
ncbi:MAG: type III-A CRISPR-associated RAMP protein Csm5 [Chloroflexales bacterium]